MAPQSGYISNFRSPNRTVIEPVDGHCFQSDPCELLAGVHGGHPVRTRLELAKGARNFRMRRHPAANRADSPTLGRLTGSNVLRRPPEAFSERLRITGQSQYARSRRRSSKRRVCGAAETAMRAHLQGTAFGGEGSGCWTEEHYLRGLYRTMREGNPLLFALLWWTRRAPPAARQHLVRALGAPNHIWRRPWFETLTFFS